MAGGGDGAELRRQWAVASDTVVVGTASAIKQRKRLEDFVHLIHELRRQGLAVLGVIAGGGRFSDSVYHQRVRDLIRELDLERYCLMVGNVEAITAFYRALDISVNTAEMEILSMSLCEAMACGVPTVAYDVGGNREALPDPWCVAAFGDLPALTEKVVKLVTDAEFRRTMGEQAARHVRAHFDGPVLAARQAAIYEEILGRPLAGAKKNGATGTLAGGS